MGSFFVHSYLPSAWIEISGEDAFSFLQGQFSNNLAQPQEHSATYGLWLDRKGKVVADSFILQKKSCGVFIVFSYFCSAATLLDRLEPYIVADDVNLRDRTTEMRGFSIWGKGAEGFLASNEIPDPAHGQYEKTVGGGWVFGGRRSRTGSFEVLLPLEAAEGFVATVRGSGEEFVDEEGVSRERILSRIPAVPEDIGPRDLPQEGSLEVDAVSFDKGCYLGQEVMARLRSMGQVRKALVGVEGEGAPPTVPAPLLHGEKEAGEVRSVAAASSGWKGLALIRKQAISEGADFFLKGKESVYLTDK